MKEIKVAIIGYGGIARMHTAAYQQLAAEGIPVRLVAVCDKSIDRIRAKTDINIGSDSTELSDEVRLYTDIDLMLRCEDFDAADVCLPSFLHADVAVKCLEAGKHVLCEKPMALSVADAERMVVASEKYGRRLMVGHCLRYSPAYRYLKELVDGGALGKLESLTMNRHSVYPTWGADRWHDDKAKCGGCLIDTHVHDVDVARYLLGEPDRVSAVTFDNIPQYQYVNTRLHFGDVKVVIDGSWDASYSEVFRADYRARFERGTVYYDFNTVSVYREDGERFTPDISAADPYTEEIRFFVTGLADGSLPESTASDAYKSMLLIEAIADSASRCGEYINYEINR